MTFSLQSSISVKIRDLACVRGGRMVFAGLNADVGAGECLAVTGPNGAGKTSLLRILADLLPAFSGAVTIRPAGDPALKHFLAYGDGLKAALTLRETLSFWSTLYAGEESDGVITRAAERVGLGHALDLPCGVFSAGQRRRAGLARLLLAPRPLWLLDEPGSALDSAGEVLLGELMAEQIAAGGVIVAATHQPLPLTNAKILRMAQ